jgi:D-amino peptidase
MNLYITLDAEGVTTITALDQVRHGQPEFADLRRLLTQEINASIEGALTAGAEAILVNEGHGKHRNVLPEQLHTAAHLLTGREKLLHYMHGVEGYDGMFMIGYHAGPYHTRAVLSHTFHAYDLTVNGRRLSEIGMGMALAGHYGVPTLLVTGDEAACEEARALVPAVETVAVKQGISSVAAIHLHPQVAQARIREAAARALQRVNEISPFTLEPPFTIEIQLYSTLMADMHEYVPGCIRSGERSVEYKADSFPEIFKFMLLSATLSMTTKGLTVMV